MCLSPLMHLQPGVPHVRAIVTMLPLTSGASWTSLVSRDRASRSFFGRWLRCFTLSPPDMLYYISIPAKSKGKIECEYALSGGLTLLDDFINSCDLKKSGCGIAVSEYQAGGTRPSCNF